ncbi:hypothetical protein AAY473_025878, partial [Plecturocebus cupreus]
MKFFCFLVFLWQTPLPHRAGPSWVRCACCETLSPQRFQLLFSLWGWDQPSPSVPYTPHREALRWGAGKTAAPAKRIALATRVAPLRGISRSVGNKNSSEKSDSVTQAAVAQSQLTATSASGFKRFSCLSLLIRWPLGLVVAGIDVYEAWGFAGVQQRKEKREPICNVLHVLEAQFGEQEDGPQKSSNIRNMWAPGQKVNSGPQ